MKTNSFASLLLATVAALAVWTPTPTTAAPLDSSFTYQGQLNDVNGPANGDYDFSFRLFRTAATASLAYGPITNVAVAVTEGQFTTSLDFGTNVFDGTAYWLRIEVRTNTTNVAASFAILTPRQKLTATPYAHYAPQAGFADSAGNATTANSATSAGFASIAAQATNATTASAVTANSITAAGIANATITASKLATNIAVWTKLGTDIYYTGGSVGIGTSTPGFPLNFANANGDKISLYGQSGNNYGFGIQSSLLQIHSDASSSDIAFGYGSSLNTTSMTETVRFKGNGNVGIGTSTPVRLLDVDGAAQLRGTPGGIGLVVRDDNNVGFGTAADYTGFASRVLAIQGDATDANFAGTSAIVLENPVNNTKWSISTFTDGSLHFTKSGATGSEAVVVGGDVTCTAVNITSDRNAKEGFTPVNARAVLAKVARLPISEWQYKTQTGARHIGPMAQDFHAAFAVGHDEKHITTVDADGVALAAIQGLNEKLDEKDAELSRLQSENQSLAARLAAIERELGLRNEATPARP